VDGRLFGAFAEDMNAQEQVIGCAPPSECQIEHCVEELLQGGYVWWLFRCPKSSSNAIAQIGVNEFCQIKRAADGSGIGKS